MRDGSGALLLTLHTVTGNNIRTTFPHSAPTRGWHAGLGTPASFELPATGSPNLTTSPYAPEGGAVLLFPLSSFSSVHLRISLQPKMQINEPINAETRSSALM